MTQRFFIIKHEPRSIESLPLVGRTSTRCDGALSIGGNEMNEQFGCDCGGEVKEIDCETVLHCCRRKYAPLTSYYDGVERPVRYQRVRVNPELTGGVVKYNWYVAWQTA